MFQFLKNTKFIHIFYCTILLIVSYLLLCIYPSPQECRLAESNAKCLEGANQIAENFASMTKNAIDEQVKAYQNGTNVFLQNTANISCEKYDSLLRTINRIQKELKATFKQDSSLFNAKFSAFTPRKVLKMNKINELKNAFEFYEDTSFVNRFEPTIWQNLQPKIADFKDKILWDKINTLSFVSANAQLEAMKMAAIQTHLLILNYTYHQVKGDKIVFDKLALAFYTEKPTVKVGEPMLAYINLYNYASKLDSNYTIICNGKELAIKDGIAHYETNFQRAGKHTFVASGIYKNPLTRQTETVKREYTIDVLPK